MDSSIGGAGESVHSFVCPSQNVPIFYRSVQSQSVLVFYDNCRGNVSPTDSDKLRLIVGHRGL
jgi:hypothetical protein